MKVIPFFSVLLTCTSVSAHDEDVAPHLRVNTKTGSVKSIGYQFTNAMATITTKDDECTHGDDDCNTDDECCSKYCRDGLCHADKCKGEDRGCGHGHNDGSKECCSGSCVNNTCVGDNNRQASTTTTKKMTSRERISKYVQEKQMFWITDSANKQGVMLREDPEAADQTNFFESSSKGRYVHVKWFCTPKHAPDANGDGIFDNLVAHSVSFMSADYDEETKTATARKWDPQGYTASWFEEGGYYNEVQVDFDDSTVFHFNGPSILAYESSTAGSTGGLVVSGEGEWIFDTNHPILQAFAKEVGSELTPEACHDKYAEVWNANNKVPPT